MREREFLKLLETSFPFDHDDAVLRIVSQGAALSDNAALAVGVALVACPQGKFTYARLALLELLCLERPTEAVQAAAPAIALLIRNAPLTGLAVQQLAGYCEKHTDCISAQKLLYACATAPER